MSVNSKTVAGRRTLHFASLDEVLADAERLVCSGRTKMLGNWPLEKLLTHLAMAIDSSIDGVSFQAPLLIRLVGPLLKRRIVNSKMPAGFKLPASAVAGAFPAAASPQAALAALRAAVARSRSEKMTARHPVLGKLTHDQWKQIHLRHAELHLSFAAD